MDRDCIFSLLLVSSLVATKFWQDTGIDFGFTSELFGIPKKELGEMERQFLLELNYDLYLSEKDLEAFGTSSTITPALSS